MKVKKEGKLSKLPDYLIGILCLISYSVTFVPPHDATIFSTFRSLKIQSKQIGIIPSLTPQEHIIILNGLLELERENLIYWSLKMLV